MDYDTWHFPISARRIPPSPANSSVMFSKPSCMLGLPVTVTLAYTCDSTELYVKSRSPNLVPFGLTVQGHCTFEISIKKDTYIKVSVFNGILKISFQKFFIQKELFYTYICDPIFILPRFKIIPNYNNLAKGVRYPFQ